MTRTSADPAPWVHQGYRSANEWEPTNPHGDRTHGLWRPRPEFDAVEATTLWKCPGCGDVMPAGFGEDDHFNCNYPEDFPAGEYAGPPVGEWEQTAADQLPPASTTGSDQ